jgi:hypothetical protein
MTSEVFCRKIGDCLNMDCPCRHHFKRLISELYPAVRVILSNYMGFINVPIYVSILGLFAYVFASLALSLYHAYACPLSDKTIS